MQETYDTGARKMTIKPGDYVLEKNERCADSLDPRFNGPFLVINCRGAKVKIN